MSPAMLSTSALAEAPYNTILERELERRGDEAERLHRIVAGLTRTTAELSTRLPELEAPASPAEPRESPETATEQPGRVEPQPSDEGAQPRSWWRRVFGGRARRTT